VRRPLCARHAGQAAGGPGWQLWDGHVCDLSRQAARVEGADELFQADADFVTNTMGADEMVDYKVESVPDRVRAWKPDAIVDCVGGTE
jgi:NADPH-dependent curcumin reductase CurA